MKNNNKNKVTIIIIVITILIVMSFLAVNLYHNLNDKPNNIDKPSKNEIDDWRIVNDDGVKIRTSSKLFAEHKYKDIALAKISIKDYGAMDVITGEIINYSDEDIEFISFNLILLDKDGKEFNNINVAGGPIKKSGGKNLLLKQTNEDIIDTYDYKIVD